MPSTPIISSIRIEGGLFPSGFLARLATFDERLDLLTPPAYGCLPGETLRDAITDAWNRLQRVWASFQAHRASAPADGDATGDTRQRWLLPLFQVLGYTELERAPAPEIDGKTYRLSHIYRQVPIHLIGHRLALDKRVAGAAGAAASNAHGLVQEFLNRSPAHQWGIVSNGLTLRLLRDNASLTRQAYLEIDLEALFEQHAYHDFVQVWLLLHASRFTAEQPGDAVIDRWYATGTKEGVRALDRLRDNVQSAIEHLGHGFLTSAGPGNRALREALAGDRLSAQDYYREILRTVYRLLFCFVAEDRDVLLLPTATAAHRDRYARWYATSRLRRLAASRAGTPHGDGWKSLQLIFRWLSSDTGCPALGVPALGSLLWSAEATPYLDACNLSNQALFAALRALAVTNDGGVRRPIDFKNLGAEELGGIYESLLELHPEISVDSNSFSLKSFAGSERKTTGSYYTPTSLIKCLLDSALDPVVEAAANKLTPAESEQAILDLTVVDPACGSGHFLVAAAHRIAKRLASIRTGDLEPAPEAVRHALRDVISRCIYGVDLNPMSVELCKVSLWLEAIDPGRPLSFLDHRIRCGNSLIGTTPELVAKGVPDEAFDPITGDDKDTCKQRKKRNKPERASMETHQTSLFAVLAPTTGAPLNDLRRGDDATLAGVSRLRDAWQAVENDPAQQRAKWAADAWVATFLAPKTPGSPTITSDVVRVALQTGPSGLDAQQRVVIQMMAEEYRVFHWHIAFPELFGEGRPNGFSVVLGNPPWERTSFEDLLFFAAKSPEISRASTTSERRRLIDELRENRAPLYQEYIAEKTKNDAEQKAILGSGRYPLTAVSRADTYALFSELAITICRNEGYVGLILPTGIATAIPLQYFWESTFGSGMVKCLYDFENRTKYFPGVDTRKKFCLISMRRKTLSFSSTSFGFFLPNADPATIQKRSFPISPQTMKRINPSTGQPPIVPNIEDLMLLSYMHSNSKSMGDDNPAWVGYTSASTGDSWIKDDAVVSGSDVVGLIEGKMIYLCDSRFATYEGCSNEEKEKGQPHLSDDKRKDNSYRVLPRFYVPAKNAEEFRDRKSLYSKALAVYRDYTSATNERTLISSLIVGGVPMQPLNGFSCKTAKDLVLSLVRTSSMVVDYAARLKTPDIHLNVTIFNQLPGIPFAIACGSRHFEDEILYHALELIHVSKETIPVANDLGYFGPPFKWNDQRRQEIFAEIDALFFHLYFPANGQGEWIKSPEQQPNEMETLQNCFKRPRDVIGYVLDTFPIIKRKDESQYGEYRTKRLILESYDAMADAIRAGRPIQTKLDPPPGDPRCAHGYTPPARQIQLPTMLATPASLDDWARATVIAASVNQTSQPIARLRLTQYLLGRPSLVTLLISGSRLDQLAPAPARAATSRSLRQAITDAIVWAELTEALKRQGDGTISHEIGFDQARHCRPWLDALWPPIAVALARQAAEAAGQLLDDLRAGRQISADQALIRELQEAEAA